MLWNIDLSENLHIFILFKFFFPKNIGIPEMFFFLIAFVYKTYMYGYQNVQF